MIFIFWFKNVGFNEREVNGFFMFVFLVFEMWGLGCCVEVLEVS